MSTPKQLNGEPFQAYTTHATEAVASKAAASGKVHYITDISSSSDKAGALVLVKDGTTIIWAAIIAANTSYNHSFVNPLKGTSGNLVSVTVDGTAACKANIAGFTVRE